ncbi:MAG TPA: hypothetical protein DD490_23180 [Acidobacteria bacterium]|nr:hypothetical protein [Acidobacteriota bacterium]
MTHAKRRQVRAWGLFAPLILIALSGGPPLAAQQHTRPLTAEDVACNERQLGKLLERLSAGKEIYLPPQLSTTLLLSPGDATAQYHGLVSTYQGFRLGPGEIPPTNPYEHYLAFTITGATRALFLNPARRPLPQVTLTRERSESNLVEPGGYFDIELSFDAGLHGAPLNINNFAEPRQGEAYNGFLATGTTSGRGLLQEGLFAPCHDKLTAFDHHMFAVLQRVVRTEPMSEYFAPDLEIAVFRGEDPHTYRIDFYSIYEEFEPRGRVSVEVTISWDESGRLGGGELRIFPACTVEGQLGCSNLRNAAMSVNLVGPVFGGRERYSIIQRAGFYASDLGPSEPSPLDFAALLANSTWNEPAW